MTTKAPDAFSGGAGKSPTFEQSAKASLADAQLRRNLGKATRTIREKRKVAVEEMPDWEKLREAGRALKDARHAPPRRVPVATGRVGDEGRRAGALGARRRGS